MSKKRENDDDDDDDCKSLCLSGYVILSSCLFDIEIDKYSSLNFTSSSDM